MISTYRALPQIGENPHKHYRLGIMGGTFDPIHNGHLVAAETAYDALELDLVIFMPAGVPAFKRKKQVSPAEDRYAMTLLATADNPHFVASRFEIDRPGVTYTADTLHMMRDFYPENVELFFITGADAISEILTWHNAESLASEATLVAATRPGYDLEPTQRKLEHAAMHFDVRYLEVPALAISSSYLRSRIEKQQSLRYLTPDSVTGYIHKHGLYGTVLSVYKPLGSL